MAAYSRRENLLSEGIKKVFVERYEDTASVLRTLMSSLQTSSRARGLGFFGKRGWEEGKERELAAMSHEF